jgi:hypothetical protein
MAYSKYVILSVSLGLRECRKRKSFCFVAATLQALAAPRIATEATKSRAANAQRIPSREHAKYVSERKRDAGEKRRHQHYTFRLAAKALEEGNRKLMDVFATRSLEEGDTKLSNRFATRSQEE